MVEDWRFGCGGYRWIDGDLAYGAMGFNVLQDFRKMPTPMPKDGEVEANDEDGAGPDGVKGEMKKEPTGRDALSDKAKLNAWFLC